MPYRYASSDFPPACRCAGKRTVLGQDRVTITTDSEGRVASVQVFEPERPDPAELPEGSVVLTPEEAALVDRWGREVYGSFTADELRLWARLPDTEDRYSENRG